MTREHAIYLCLVMAVLCGLGLIPPARAQMDADFSGGGAIRVGTSTTTCGSGYTGTIRYNSGTNLLQYCNSSAWTNMAISTLGVDDLTDAKADYTVDNNMAFGSAAGNALATGGQLNIFMGESSGSLNTTADQNYGIGYQALKSVTTNSQNGGFGFKAMTSNTDANNWGFGASALQLNTTGFGNVAVGSKALLSNTGTDYSVGVGYSAVSGARTTQNVGIGSEVMFTSVGGNTTAVGRRALYLATGANNTALGYQAGDNITSGANNIIIGYDIDAPSATGSNQLSIGNLIFGTGVDGTGTTVSGGAIGIGLTNPASMFVVQSPSAESITAGATITANACGTIKKLTSAGNVTTDTTNTFTSPTSGYDGCCMDVYNTGANTITLDQNAKFKTSGGANVSLTSGSFTKVCSNGANWYQTIAVMTPS